MTPTRQPKVQPRTGEDQTLARQPNPDGQEDTAGPTGQTPTGRKVQGQYVPVAPGSQGQETAALGSKRWRPNR